MDAKKTQRYRTQLLDLQARMHPEMEAIAEAVRRPSGGQDVGELSNAPMHLADRGTDEFLQDVGATLLANEEHLSIEVRDALRRIDEDRFGDCERCGEAIPTARLDAIPYARHCTECAILEEAEGDANVNAGRPRSPRDTMAPEGEMGERRLDRGRQNDRDDLAARGEYDGAFANSADVHAAGTAGGGTALGGLAGTTVGHGDPDVASIEDATGSGDFDVREARRTASRRAEKF